MVSFSLRQRISYRFLKDPSPVSFHLIQFALSCASRHKLCYAVKDVII
jgi:hypothetical protein